jgi:ribonuclease HI
LSPPAESAASARLTVNFDGGARGNPGEAAIAAVVSAPDGALLEERGEAIGVATNNVAEYRALLLAIERARALGASEVELIGDSELVVRQVRGEYRVKDPGLRPLHAAALEALAPLERWSIRNVPRAENAAADELVNATLDSAGAR